MILSDVGIRSYLESGDLRILDAVPPEGKTVNEKSIQPASVDLHLHEKFVYFPRGTKNLVDPLESDTKNLGREVILKPWEKGYVLRPSEFTLASTSEWIQIGGGIVGKLEGKSSLGRLGLIVHSTAGFIDPGFRGQITLELHNLFPYPLLLTKGMAICQIAFHILDQEVAYPYGHPKNKSKYQDQVGPVPSRYFLSGLGEETNV